MTKVFLRVYNREIEGLIEASQLDEAIAHCQHILKTFPMYVETYRLLGKTFLEARRYGDAADIFQRALMAVPDDFVSHVGMSIIRDDEGKLDDAIWHMERAFEIQPSNSAIQSELRRLYGRRDGVEPPKIRLSRDALANMYSQGELFNQAIAEIRAVLADDPNRPDLQVMLARAYYKAGQKVEAAEMAAILLKKFPYCMDALKVLVEVLPGTTQGENTQIYRHRLGMLDPYSVFAKDTVFATDQVGDANVSIERLDYKPGTAAAAAQPDWASSLGIKLGTEKKAEATPDWLKPGAATPPPDVPPPTDGMTTPTGNNDALPDWMKSAGWQPSAGAPEIPPEEISQEPGVEPLAQAEIPDWLKSMAPAAITEPEPAEETLPDLTSGDDGDIPDWLKPKAKAEPEPEMGDTKPMLAATPMQTPPVSAVPPAAEEAEVPDWLKSLAPEMPTDVPAPAAAETPLVEPAAETEVPDWLKSLAPEAPVETTPQASTETPPTEPAAEADIPDWLAGLAPASAETPVEPAAEESPVQAVPEDVLSAAPAETDLPGWLNATAPAVPPETPKSESQPTMEPMAADIPDWLKSSAPESTPAAEVPPETAPIMSEPAAAAPAEEFEMPDWLKSPSPQAEVPPAEPEPTNLEPPAMIEPQAEEAPATPTMDADLPDWLKGLAPEPTIPAEAAPEASTDQISMEMPIQGGDLPEWLKSPAVEAAPSEPEPPQDQALPPEADPTPEADLPDWLKSLSSEAPAEPEPAEATAAPLESAPVEPKAEEPLETAVPDWFNNLTAEPEKTSELPDTQPTEAVSLNRPAEAQPAEAGGLPDWLSGLEAEETPAIEATQPGTTAETVPMAVESGLPAVELPVEKAPDVQAPAVSEPLAAGIEGFVPTGEAKKLEIGDDALGWLESLAAKQGANPDELLTKPQERAETMPDWLTSTEEPKAEVPAEEAPKQPLQTLPLPSLDAYIKRDAARQPLETLPLRPIDILGSDAFAGTKIHPEEPPAETEPPAAQEPAPASELIPEPEGPKASQPVKVEDDALAWLESLAANQGAKPEELLTKPEDRPEKPPEWVQNAAAEQPTAEVPAETPLAEPNQPTPASMVEPIEPAPAEAEVPVEIPMGAPEAPPAAAEMPEEPQAEAAKPEVVPAEEPKPAEIPAEEDITVTTFLSQIKAEELGLDGAASVPAAEEAPTPSEELPDWLKDVDSQAAPETPAAAVEAESDLPDWLRTPAETAAETPVVEAAAEEVQLEPAPEPKTEAEPLPAWMEESSPVSAAAPTEPDEWIPIDEFTAAPAAIIAQEEECPPVAAEPSEPAAAEPVSTGGTLAPVPTNDQDAGCLAAAQSALDKGDLNEAIAEYEKLVRKGSLLDEVIHDLREATYRFPVDVIVWQTVGDAYMRANRLQDALDAYTKAEELLR